MSVQGQPLGRRENRWTPENLKRKAERLRRSLFNMLPKAPGAKPSLSRPKIGGGKF
jgi:hypothetical protein